LEATTNALFDGIQVYGYTYRIREDLVKDPAVHRPDKDRRRKS